MSKGVLLVNFGSPLFPRPEKVKEFLSEVMMNPMITDAPLWKRKLLLKLNLNKKKIEETTQLYEKIRMPNGSPLIAYSKQLQRKVQKRTLLPIELGMRHSEPSLRLAINKLNKAGANEILVIPLYPQYTMSTTWSAVNYIKELGEIEFPETNFIFMNSFYNHPDFIMELGEKIRNLLPLEYDKLLFSFQGIPQKHENYVLKKRKTEESPNIKTYEEQSRETAELLRKELGLAADKVITSFQSSSGKNKISTGSTENLLKRLPKENIKNLAVVCPSFVTDNLQTLGRINIEGKETFLKNGGKNFTYIHCLNDDQPWVELLDKWIDEWASKSN